MGNLTEILNTVLPVILMLVSGLICRRSRLLSREGIAALKSVVVNITLPAVMLNAFATMEYSGKNIILTILMFGICVIAWVLGKVLGNILHIKSEFVSFLSTGFEAGMLGYSLFILLYGPEKIGTFASIDLGQVLFVFTLYKILLSLNGKQQLSAGQLLKDMIKSPTIIAIIIGVLMGATPLYGFLSDIGIASVLNACTDFVSAPTSGIILLTIGYDLVFQNVMWSMVGKTVVTRVGVMVVLRVIAGILVRTVGLGDGLDSALNIMFILPPPYVLPVFADDEKQREFISSTLSVMTMVSIVAFVLLACFGV